MIKTFNLTIRFDGGYKTYNNISRTAVKYYVEWYRENKEFCSYVLA